MDTQGGHAHDQANAVAYTTRRGETYYLHAATVALPNGRTSRSYYFAPRVDPARAVAAWPADYVAVESPYTRRPSLRKRAAPH